MSTRGELPWILRHIWLTISLISALVLGLSYIAALCQENERDTCITRGGAWVKTGTVTAYVLSGNVIIPISTDTHECVKAFE